MQNCSKLQHKQRKANVSDSHTVKYSTQRRRCFDVFFSFYTGGIFGLIQTCCSGRSQNHRCPAPRWPCSSRGLWRRSSSPRWCRWSVPRSSRTDARTWPEDDTDTFIRISVCVVDDWLPAQSSLARRQWTVTDATATSENVTISVSQTFLFAGPHCWFKMCPHALLPPQSPASVWSHNIVTHARVNQREPLWKYRLVKCHYPADISRSVLFLSLLCGLTDDRNV